jgi:hypothetical protein
VISFAYLINFHHVFLSLPKNLGALAPHEAFPDWGSWQRKALTDEVNHIFAQRAAF